MRLSAFLLALVLCLSLCACGAPAAENPDGPASATTEPSAEVTPSPEPSPEPAICIADTLDPAEYEIKWDEYTIPCLRAFSGGEIGAYAERHESGELHARLPSVNQKQDLFFEYLDLLINEFGFVVTDSTLVDFEARTLSGNWAITLDSTRVSASKTVGGDLPLYTPAHIKFSGMHGIMEVSPGFMMQDTGHRWSGAEPDTNTVVTGIDGKLSGFHRRSVGGEHMHFYRDIKLTQRIDGFLHHGQIAVAAHYDSDLLHNFPPKT